MLLIIRRYCAPGQIFKRYFVWSKTISLNSNMMSQIYNHKCGLSAVYHISRASGFYLGYSLNDFIGDYDGAPERLAYDGAAIEELGQSIILVVL